jgi:tripartite-type tricarboxylate transporter receptor subunit TctC
MALRTTRTRAETLPDIPTVGEFVPGYEASVWFGVGAPKATPAEIVDKLNEELNAGLADPGYFARSSSRRASEFVNPRSIKVSSNASRSHLGSILCMMFR